MLVSSHVLAEVEQVADDVLILARGRIVKAGALSALRAEYEATIVRASEPGRLAEVLSGQGHDVLPGTGGELVVSASCEAVGHAAAEAGVELHLLRASGGLAEAFLHLTAGQTR